MTNQTTRRNVITGAAALPLLPAAALAASVTLPLLPVAAFAMPGNATDTAWSAYEAAKANYEAAHRDFEAMEASLPEHLKISAHPGNPLDWKPGEWQKKVDAWKRGRAELGTEAPGEACDKAADRQNNAEAAVLDTPGTSLTDIERKLAIVSGWNGDNDIPAELVDGILADVRSLNREGVS